MKPANKLNVVDADSHVTEPMSAWKDLKEDHRPRIERDEMGFEHVFVGTELLVTGSLGNIATPGAKMSDFEHMRPLEEAEAGGFDPKLHLEAMDTEGIDAAVMFPTVGLNFWAVREQPAAVALARAYNDWLSAYCATAPVAGSGRRGAGTEARARRAWVPRRVRAPQPGARPLDRRPVA
jgi:hypothetical protein